MMRKAQNTFQFILVLKNVDEFTPNLEDILYESGCDDALINFRNAAVYMDFSRKADSLEEAVLSAIRDVESSSIGAVVSSVAPENLVTETEIAKRLNLKRQTVSLWIKGERRKTKAFPKPFLKLSEKSPFWKWHEILAWLHENDIPIEMERVKEAWFLETINMVLSERDVKLRKSRKMMLSKFEKYQIQKHL